MGNCLEQCRHEEQSHESIPEGTEQASLGEDCSQNVRMTSNQVGTQNIATTQHNTTQHITQHYTINPCNDTVNATRAFSELQDEIKQTLIDRVKNDLSKIHIPGTNWYLPLQSVVIDQSMRRVLIHDKSKVQDKSRNKDPRHYSGEIYERNCSGKRTYRSSQGSFDNQSVEGILRFEGSFESVETDSDSKSISISEYESDSTNSDESNSFVFDETDCYEAMLDVVTSEKNNPSSNRRIVIVGDGGLGKSTTAQKFLTLWAYGHCLQDIFAVVWIDMKCVNYEVDLFENMRLQHPIMKKINTQSENIKDVFEKCADRVIYIFDALDECPSPDQGFKFYNESQQEYHKSIFIILTRPDGKDVIAPAASVEFAINPFKSDQFYDFIHKFPFDNDEKRQALSTKVESDKVIKKCFPIPMYAAMICALFNYEISHINLENPLDIYKALFGMILRAAEIKLLEKKISSEKNPNEKAKLSRLKRELIREP